MRRRVFERLVEVHRSGWRRLEAFQLGQPKVQGLACCDDRRTTVRTLALRSVPESVFEAELRPEIERKFLVGEKDHVERERRATSVD